MLTGVFIYKFLKFQRLLGEPLGGSMGRTLVLQQQLREGRQAHQVVQHAAGVGVQRGVVVRRARRQRAAALAPRRLQVLQPRHDTYTFFYRFYTFYVFISHTKKY